MTSEQKLVDQADAEIMSVVYEWTRINFGVEAWAQDSTEIREILDSLLTRHEQELRERLAREFEEQFTDRFTEIARLADRRDDVGYGKGLARLQIEIVALLRNTK